MCELVVSRAGNFCRWLDILVGFFSHHVFHRVNSDVTALRLVIQHENLLVAIAQGDMLGLEAGNRNSLHHLAILDVEHVEADGSRARNQQLAVFGNVDGTAGLLNLENTDTLALKRGEHADSSVIGAREQ